MTEENNELPWEQRPWTDQELHSAMIFGLAKNGAEIVEKLESGELDTSVWVEMDIPDSVVWLQEQRRKERQMRRMTVGAGGKLDT